MTNIHSYCVSEMASIETLAGDRLEILLVIQKEGGAIRRQSHSVQGSVVAAARDPTWHHPRS